MTAAVTVRVADHDGTVVARPSGRLGLTTYAQLRDGLLKAVSDEPRGLVVVLDGLAVTEVTALSVFATVWLRVVDWPGVPMVLVAGRDPVRALLAASAVPRFVPTFDDLPAALDAVGRPAARRRQQVPLGDGPGIGRRARRVVRETCTAWGVAQVARDAAVVASELAENAGRHARGPRWLRLELRRGMLTVAVADADPTPARVRPVDQPVPGGRGLVLVDALARTWGQAARLDGGKVVWAVLRVPDESGRR